MSTIKNTKGAGKMVWTVGAGKMVWTVKNTHGSSISSGSKKEVVKKK